MKLTLFLLVALTMLSTVLVLFSPTAKQFAADCAYKAHDAVFGYMANRGMVSNMVLLSRTYNGYLAGTIVQLPTNVEAALIAQGLATTSAGPVTTGAVTTTESAGRVAIAAGASSVVVTNPRVDANSKITAVINQAAADGTLLRVERVVPAAGSFTIYGTANATATTSIDWALQNLSGEFPATNSTL